MVPFQAVVLAAGKGTRMKSAKAKVLHPVLGVPLLGHVLRAVRALLPGAVSVVIGHQAEAVQAAFADAEVSFVVQDPPKGTGHALQCARDAIAAQPGLPLLVVSGDVPLLRVESLRALLDAHHAAGAACTLLTMIPAEAGAYGRIVRDAAGGVKKIVEAKDASPEELRVREVNAGIYVFDVAPLLGVLGQLTADNAQGEYYLTDLVGLLAKQKLPVRALAVEDPGEALGVNSQEELADAALVLRRRRNRDLMVSGVRLEQPETIEVGLDVVVEADATLRPYTILEGRTVVRSGAVVGPFARLQDAEIGAGAQVLDHCLLRECVVGEGAAVGPFAHIRPETTIGARAKVGNFVELKKTTLGEGSKAPHLSYLGDATIGKGVNVGAGTITCNYDGTHKHPTVLGDGVFVGSNSTLVAPLNIGAGAYVGAGSAVTEDVPKDALTLGRSRQVVKEGWAARRRESLKDAKGHP